MTLNTKNTSVIPFKQRNKSSSFENTTDTRVTVLENETKHINTTLLRIEDKLTTMESKFETKLTFLDTKIEALESKIEARINLFDTKIDNNFKWVLGLIVVTILVPIVLKFVH